MKKLFLATMLLSSMALSAQSVSDSTSVKEAKVESNEFKADPGSFMAEIGFAPMNGTYEDINLIGGQIKGIYVLSEKIELKLGVGFGLSKEASENGMVGDEWEKESTRVSSFSINPGFNYTFEGTKKLEPYVGAEVGFGLTASKEVRETVNSKVVRKNVITGLNKFEVLALAGFNYFFAKNIFVGAEFGLGLGVDVKKGSYVETTTNGSVNKAETVDEAHSVEFSPMVTPTIRLGWAF